MDKTLKGTKTEQNLMKAFEGESMANVKYNLFSGRARKEGHVDIAKFFEATANDERAHASTWLKALAGIGETHENLLSAARGEHFEWSDMYKEFARVAKEEGFDKLAAQFEIVGAIERDHEESYLEYARRLKEGTLYKRDKEVIWECHNCGHHRKGKEAPGMCPGCDHPQGFFYVLNRP